RHTRFSRDWSSDVCSSDLSIARALRELQADVVVLQEVENEQVTAELAAASGTYPHHVTSRGNDPRGIDIAVLSRWPIVAVRSHRSEERRVGKGWWARWPPA